MKVVGKPDAGNPLVRFEEGGGPKGPSLLDAPCGCAGFQSSRTPMMLAAWTLKT